MNKGYHSLIAFDFPFLVVYIKAQKITLEYHGKIEEAMARLETLKKENVQNASVSKLILDIENRG